MSDDDDQVPNELAVSDDDDQDSDESEDDEDMQLTDESDSDDETGGPAVDDDEFEVFNRLAMG